MRLPGLLDPRNARPAAGYASPDGYRSRIVMARHGFGRGEYNISPTRCRRCCKRCARRYPRLAPIANRWNQLLGDPQRFPATHDAFLAQCHAAGQKRPTPLILQYGADDYNCLHQDRTASGSFPCRWPSCCRDPAGTSAAVNSS